MHRRFWNAYLPIWLARALPLPWADIVVYRFFGVKVGKNVVAYEGYIDPEFVEIEDFTMTSLHISSSTNPNAGEQAGAGTSGKPSEQRRNEGSP